MTINLLASGADTTGGTAQATASISPTANSLIIAIASGTQGTSIADYGISTTLSGVTLSEYEDSGRGDAAAGNRTWRDQGAGDLRRMKLWYGASGATPGTGTITFTCGTSQGGWQWRVWEKTDCPSLASNGLAGILQVAGDDADSDVNSLSATLGALTSPSAKIAYVVVDDEADAVIVISGFTMDTVSTHATPNVSVRGGVQSPASGTAVAPSWDVGDADTGAFMVLELASTPSEPEITDIDPDEGPEAGGTSVTITGTDFQTGATVTIGGNAATSVVVVDPTEITCTTPAGTAGAVDVVVTNPDTGTDTLVGGFTYLAAGGGAAAVRQKYYREFAAG